MTAIAYLIAIAVLAHARAEVVELSCSDNATCIEGLARNFVRSIRQQKSVKLFDVLTIEPVRTRVGRQARTTAGLLQKLFEDNSFSFDWEDYTFTLKKREGRSDALDLEIYESRTAKDVSDDVPKKSQSKVQEDEEEPAKAPKRLRRRQKRKVLQAVIPLLFGMKSAGVMIFAFFIVTVLTLKAFVASKMALLVTVGMAVKKLYESYNLGAGLQNHPYLYSQYPIDFPSASSHAYSVSGVSSQFGSPEMFNPGALQGNEILQQQQQQDASAQQSQQAPTLQLANATRASERWDGYRRRPIFYGQSRAGSDSYSAYRRYRH